MELNLKGKSVLIAGLGLGLGRSTAEAFAKKGADVFAISRSEKDLGEINLKKIFIGDLTEDGKVLEAVKSLEPENGFDAVVHCIGDSKGFARDPLSNWEEWGKALKLNVGIAMNINTLVVPKMKDKKYGRIVHIGSISGDHLLGQATYCGSKSLLEDYSKMLSRQLAPDGVVVSCIRPGAFEFPGGYWESQLAEKKGNFIKNHVKAGRLGRPDDIVPFILLLSSELASYASGTSLNIDGGYGAYV